ncbi:hypothetical protein ACH4D5_08240 [Streptomyces sp. NPDC018029]|uniref:hypothetical protein n=1 Tax=Streptomyces sp. NPDC018029 TaxID=3365032 RepID=UPI0037A7BF34
MRSLGRLHTAPARQLRAARSRIIRLSLLDTRKPPFADLVAAAERAAREAGLGVARCGGAQGAGEEAAHLGLFAERQLRSHLMRPAEPESATPRASGGAAFRTSPSTAR